MLWELAKRLARSLPKESEAYREFVKSSSGARRRDRRLVGSSLEACRRYHKLVGSSPGACQSQVQSSGRSEDDAVGNSPGVRWELAESIGSLPGWLKGVHQKKTKTRRKIIEGSQKAYRELGRS
ncbi:hypothetical protein BHM03_00018390 [Ensete ventricosum]|uniref:Uncharacterized protein n=1 Tax=Ensete ventricosum TaxID=4639 RepID=A0A445MFB4_ENSVE|nr:hypothetical protein BHM03_00018390 [Ensete ventricosum]